MKIIPLGDRLLVKRRTIGAKIGKESLLFAAETTADRPTDLADVLAMADGIETNIKVGDTVMISKYIGTDFNTGDSQESLTVVRIDDIICLIRNEE